MGALFAVSRESGKSNAEVLVEYLGKGKPGDVFTYDQLAASLGEGSPRKFDRDAVRRAITSAYSKILRELQRTVRPVRNVGYQMVSADEHSDVAMERKKRGDRQLRKGYEASVHVRHEELSADGRLKVDAIAVVLGAVIHQVQGHEKRIRNIEDTIKKSIGKSV